MKEAILQSRGHRHADSWKEGRKRDQRRASREEQRRFELTIYVREDSISHVPQESRLVLLASRNLESSSSFRLLGEESLDRVRFCATKPNFTSVFELFCSSRAKIEELRSSPWNLTSILPSFNPSTDVCPNKPESDSFVFG